MSKHRKTDPKVDVALPIVPMLDMSFQLLFFFIITFNPGQMEGFMAMNLPADGSSKQNTAVSDAQPDVMVDLPADFTVVVRSAGAGLGKITIRDAEKVTDITGDGNEEKLDDLFKKLKAKLDDKKKVDTTGTASQNIKIEADSALKYSALVQVMDACIKAGYQQVGFAPPPDLNR